MTSDASELESEFSLDDILMDRDMKRLWDIGELIEHFTLVDEDKDILENKTGTTLLGCVLLLKYIKILTKMCR